MSADATSAPTTEPTADRGGPGLAYQWQIPLLLLAVSLFVISLLQLRPPPEPPTFAQRLAPLQHLLRAKLYDLVVEDARAMLEEEDLPPLHAALLYRLLAEATYLAERSRPSHDAENAEWIIRHLARAEANGFTLAGEDWRRSGAAWEWLGNPERALDNYSLALLAGLKDALEVERRVMVLREELGRLSEDQRHTLLDRFMAHARGAPGELLWALREKIDLFSKQGDWEAARELLARASADLQGMREHQQVDFLRGLLLYRAGRYDDAERVLRAVRAKLGVRDETYAQATCLLGRLNLRDLRPYAALAFYGDILDSYTEGPYLAASLLGAAEARAALEDYAAAAEHYRELINLLPFDFEARFIDQEAVRTSLASLYESLRGAGRPVQGLVFMEMANQAAAGAEDAVQGAFLGRLAEAHVSAAEHYKKLAVQASPAETGPTAGPPAESAESTEVLHAEPAPLELAHEHYRLAADTFLRLAERGAGHDAEATRALWMAAENYDRAGETESVIKTLREFTLTHRSSSLLPDALLRLGQSHQAAGQYEQAAEAYQANLAEFPRTPAALDSVVPLAECYLAMGEQYFDRAEQVLSSLLDQSGENEALVTPSARQYQQALFLLGDMYVQAREYEKAATVLEESLARYADDPGTTVARFVLADSYRRSGLALKSEADSPQAGPVRLGLVSEHKRRLQRAHDLFSEVVEDLLQGRGDLDQEGRRQYLRLSLSYQADCLFDLGLYQQAIPLYEEVSWRYHDSPGALSAYVQIINCYQRLGRRDEAVTALKRAKQLVGRISEERFDRPAGGMTRRQWEEFLSRVGDSPLFR